MNGRGVGWMVVAVVLGISACVAEPGSSGLPLETRRPDPPPATASAAPSPPAPTGVEPTPAAAPSPATGSTVTTLSGDGSVRSAPFAVDEDWALAWRREGTRLFSIQLLPADVDVFGEIVVSTTEPTSGSSPMYVAGTFVVQVHASEPWTLRVIDVLPLPARSIPAAAIGVGPANTGLFTSDGSFLVEWSTDRAVALGIELVTLTTGEPLLVAAARHAESSCREVSVADDFYLHVATDAGWTITLRPRDGEVICPAD